MSEDRRPEQLGGSFGDGGLARALNARDEDQQALRAQSQLRHGVLFSDAGTMVRLKQRTRNRPGGLAWRTVHPSHPRSVVSYFLGSRLTARTHSGWGVRLRSRNALTSEYPAARAIAVRSLMRQDTSSRW